MHDTPEQIAALCRVVRLKPYQLEVVRQEPGKPWDTCVGSYAKRKDAERAVRAVVAKEDGDA